MEEFIDKLKLEINMSQKNLMDLILEYNSNCEFVTEQHLLIEELVEIKGEYLDRIKKQLKKNSELSKIKEENHRSIHSISCDIDLLKNTYNCLKG